MLLKLTFVTLFSLVLCKKSCYWNNKCKYDLFSSKTPYDSVRGDLRDQPDAAPECKAISIWSLNRHGNRNPGTQVTEEIKILQEKIWKEITENTDYKTYCSQDIEDLKSWSWNSTMDKSAAYLTGVGYEEIYDIGKRIRHKYFDSLLTSSDSVYVRPTNEQRTLTSAKAFVHGLTDGLTYLNTHIDGPRQRDDVIRPYENCELYQEEVKFSQLLADELAAYDSSAEFLAVQYRVQSKLNIKYQLTAADVYNLYELCRFERGWTQNLQSPWCSFFTDEDLVVLEYRDDVRHYYRNGYGSWVNTNLGNVTMRDLYENFVSAASDNGRSVVSYFTHDTMLEMVFCALGLYKDPEPLRGSQRNRSRLWRTSEIAALAVNLMAVLYRCEESGMRTHRVKFLINEKPTTLCPDEGCTWRQFVEMFQVYSNANLDFCTGTSSDSDTNASTAGNYETTLIHRVTLSFMTLITLLVVYR